MKRTVVILSLLFCLCGFAEQVKPLSVDQFEKRFEKIEPSAIPGNVFTMVDKDWFLVTAGTPENYNTMTISWGGLGILWSKPVTFTFINEKRYTHSFMEKYEYYTLSAYDKSERSKMAKIFGGKSGRNTDKEKESGFDPVSAPGGGISYMQARMVIVCKKIVAVPLTKEIIAPEFHGRYADGKFHTQYIGEIIGVWIRK